MELDLELELDGPSEFALILHNIHRFLLYFHEFVTVTIIQENPFFKWGV